MKKFIAMLAVAMSLTACHVVPEGKVGLRTNFDNTIDSSELLPGSFNQVFVGSVTDYPVREIQLDVKDIKPPALNGDPMGDFDVSMVYSINPSAVSDLRKQKSGEFHTTTTDGETLLMGARLQTILRNAVYKVANEYESLTMNQHREQIEQKIENQLRASLSAEKLDGSVNIGQVQVKSIEPPDAVKQSAIRLVAAKAENAAKDIEVETAKKEAERVQALSQNKGAIDYMDAQARLEIAYALREGKVNSVVVPYDFKGIVNTGK